MVMIMSSLPYPTNQNHHRVRVLIVDDTPQVRRALHQLLELTGDMEVVAEAADGQEAVCLAAQLSPAVVVMDLEMTGMDGYEATRLIRKLEAEKGLGPTRIIAMTASVMPGDREACLSCGMNDYVSKPVALTELRAALDRAFNDAGSTAA